jgi:hypothetical protein
MATVISSSRQYLNDEASFREALNKLTAANSLSVNAQGNLVPAGFFKDLFNGTVSTNRRLVEFKIMEFLVQGKKWLKPDDIKLVEQLASKVGLFMKKIDSANRHKELRSLINLIVKEILQYKSVAPKDYTKLCQDFQARYRRILSPYSEQCEQVKRTFADVFKFQMDKGKGLERLVGDKIPFVGILNNKGADPAAAARDPAAPARPAGNAMNSSAEKMIRVAKGALTTILSAAGVSAAYYTYQNWGSIQILPKPNFPVESSPIGFLGIAALGISAFALFAFKAKGGDLGQLASGIKDGHLKTMANNFVTGGMTTFAKVKDGLEDKYQQFRNGNPSKTPSKVSENAEECEEKLKDDGLDQKGDNKENQDGLGQNVNKENQAQTLFSLLRSGNEKEVDNSDKTNQIKSNQVEITNTLVKSKKEKDVYKTLSKIKESVKGICESDIKIEEKNENAFPIVKKIDNLTKFCFATINIKNDKSLIDKLTKVVNELSIEFNKLKETLKDKQKETTFLNETSSSIDSICVNRSRLFLEFSKYADKAKVSVLMEILRFRLEVLNRFLTGNNFDAVERLVSVEKDLQALVKGRIGQQDTKNIFKNFPLDELYILQKIYDLKDKETVTKDNLYDGLFEVTWYEKNAILTYPKFEIYAKEFKGWSTIFNFKEGAEIKKNLDSVIFSRENPELEDDKQVENKTNSQLELYNSNSTSQGLGLTNSNSSHSYSTSGSNQQNDSWSDSYVRAQLGGKKPVEQKQGDIVDLFQGRNRQEYPK